MHKTHPKIFVVVTIFFAIILNDFSATYCALVNIKGLDFAPIYVAMGKVFSYFFELGNFVVPVSAGNSFHITSKIVSLLVCYLEACSVYFAGYSYSKASGITQSTIRKIFCIGGVLILLAMIYYANKHPYYERQGYNPADYGDKGSIRFW